MYDEIPTPTSATAAVVRRRITILGSTGSVGRQALEVVRAYPDRFEVVGLSAGANAGLLRRQAAEFEPEVVALEHASRPKAAREAFACEALTGPGSAASLAAAPADVVLNAVVGFAGLAATAAALRARRRVALANKESLVAGGEWVMGLARGGEILPVDSEHSAIFQCLEGRGEPTGVLLTASGGPFFGLERERLAVARPEDALLHPTWQMGPKITIDSATMMNKGLEIIEAHHLFGVDYDAIRVAIHRQSVVHGGVFLHDGSVVLHAAPPDMKLPIAYALLYPERVDVGAEPIRLDDASWSFEKPRDDLFRCLPLAIAAGRAGGAYPAALNAANEAAVDAFLARKIGFVQIAEVVESVLEALPDSTTPESLDAITAVDAWAREEARRHTTEVVPR